MRHLPPQLVAQRRQLFCLGSQLVGIESGGQHLSIPDVTERIVREGGRQGQQQDPQQGGDAQHEPEGRRGGGLLEDEVGPDPGEEGQKEENQRQARPPAEIEAVQKAGMRRQQWQNRRHPPADRQAAEQVPEQESPPG